MAYYFRPPHLGCHYLSTVYDRAVPSFTTLVCCVCGGASDSLDRMVGLVHSSNLPTAECIRELELCLGGAKRSGKQRGCTIARRSPSDKITKVTMIQRISWVSAHLLLSNLNRRRYADHDDTLYVAPEDERTDYVRECRLF
jgi:hypothetical protein